MKLSVTGHRDLPILSDSLENKLIHVLYAHNVEMLISGMAIGYDMACAAAALRIKIPVIAVIPFDGQHEMWSENDIKKYEEILNNSLTTVKVLSPAARGFSHAAELYKKRNKYVVDNGDVLMAGWSGDYRSGTGYTVRYANKIGKQIYRFWAPNWEWEEMYI